MNIFYLHQDPKKAAQMHNDKHVVKMILESAQLLCTAHRLIDGVQATYTKLKKVYTLVNDEKIHIGYEAGKTATYYNLPNNHIIYGMTHQNHPSAKWVRESSEHYDWLYKLFVFLCEEYKYRYNKIHLTERKLKDVLSQKPKNLPNRGFTQPPQAMPEYLRINDSVAAYRNYYQTEKAHLATWTKRKQPTWYSL
jgi:hypothetical protein